MATINASHVWIAKGVLLSTWDALLASGDVGSNLDAARLPDKTVTVTGPTGGTTSVTIEGSNDGTNFQALTEPQGGTEIVFTSATEIWTILENPRYIRPRLDTVTSGAVSPVIYITSRADVR